VLDLRRFDVITFDCYGTLIDWETGILDALRPLRERASACVWVNRRHGRPGEGATAPSLAEPDLEVHDLRTLADAVEARA
jgi:FMN phosphatase YigB (HAD superfamily)